MSRVKHHTRRVLIGVAGGIVLLLGIVIIPYPGPGWLIVFTGLAILATEFAFADRLLKKVRAKYNEWLAWLRRQSRIVQLVSLCATGLVIVLTLWLINTFGLINTIFDLGLDWLNSPFAG